MRYYLIGPYPPPLGGVSVYIYRLARILRSSGVDLKILDFSKSRKINKVYWLIRLIVDPRLSTFHLHGLDFYVIFALLLRPFQGKYIFQDHSGRMIETISGIRWFIFSRFLLKINELILVGPHLEKYYRKSGFTLPKTVTIQNAFLPPPEDDEPKIWASYSSDTLSFIQEHSPLIIANAYRIVFYKDVDLYGLDICVELAAALKEEYPTIGLLFALADIGDLDYFDQINKQIADNQLQDKFFFLIGQKEVWPILRKAQLMVRPTFVDGYGISVAEALYMGCPAVASDVCDRAPGTVLFHNRDIRDLIDKVKSVLNGTIK